MRSAADPIQAALAGAFNRSVIALHDVSPGSEGYRQLHCLPGAPLSKLAHHHHRRWVLETLVPACSGMEMTFWPYHVAVTLRLRCVLASNSLILKNNIEFNFGMFLVNKYRIGTDYAQFAVSKLGF